MKTSTLILGLMILSYSIPILYIYWNYSTTEKSISSIIHSEACQQAILYGMIAMGCFTILYECHRGCTTSFLCIATLLIGIYGVILIKESEWSHYAFATLVFIAMACFMIKHSSTRLLYVLLFVQLILSLILVLGLLHGVDIFYCEAFLLLNFAACYLYVHHET